MENESMLTTAAGKEFAAYRAAPEGGARSGVILIHEIWGLNAHTKDVARRLAAEGFSVIAPDLLGESGVLEKLSPAIFAEMQDPATRHAAQAKMREATQPVRTEEFAQGALEKLRAAFAELQRSGTGAVGTVGFCFGGTYSFHLAVKEPALGAAVVFYGQPPQPLERVASIACPVLAFYGDQDAGLMESLPALTAAMQEHGKDFSSVVYPGAGHAFFNNENALAYRKDAADDAWQKTLRFLREKLG